MGQFDWQLVTNPASTPSPSLLHLTDLNWPHLTLLTRSKALSLSLHLDGRTWFKVRVTLGLGETHYGYISGELISVNKMSSEVFIFWSDYWTIFSGWWIFQPHFYRAPTVTLKSIFNSINTLSHSSSPLALIGLIIKHSELFILPVNLQIHSPRSQAGLHLHTALYVLAVRACLSSLSTLCARVGRVHVNGTPRVGARGRVEYQRRIVHL